MLEDISTNKLINDLDKKIKEANSGMRVASPSVVISLNMAMNITRETRRLISLIDKYKSEIQFQVERNDRQREAYFKTESLKDKYKKGLNDCREYAVKANCNWCGGGIEEIVDNLEKE